jgi:hypothetical protein
MNTIVILLFVLILSYAYIYYISPDSEDFMVYWAGGPVAPLSDIDNYPNWPFWRLGQGQTSNMSYDLRGDPIQIPKYPTMFNYSTLTPIYNKTLC